MKHIAVALVFASAAFMSAVSFAPLTAQAASYSCMNSSELNAAERRVCYSYSLSALDERLDSWYRRALERARYFDDTLWVRADQRVWLRKRNACGAKYWCLRRVYKKRIRKLKNYVEHV